MHFVLEDHQYGYNGRQIVLIDPLNSKFTFWFIEFYIEVKSHYDFNVVLWLIIVQFI